MLGRFWEARWAADGLMCCEPGRACKPGGGGGQTPGRWSMKDKECKENIYKHVRTPAHKREDVNGGAAQLCELLYELLY